jgi:hypothetical protein
MTASSIAEQRVVVWCFKVFEGVYQGQVAMPGSNLEAIAFL